MDNDKTKFGSEHDKMAQFVFLDGHLWTLHYSISLSVFQALSTIADETPISSHDY